MPEDNKEPKPVRFDFAPGTAADAIAKALNEARKRVMAAKKAKDGEQPPKEEPQQ